MDYRTQLTELTLQILRQRYPRELELCSTLAENQLLKAQIVQSQPPPVEDPEQEDPVDGNA